MQPSTLSGVPTLGEEAQTEVPAVEAIVEVLDEDGNVSAETVGA